MAKSEQQGIEKIQCGRIDYYVPLLFETKYDFIEICRRINEGIDKDIKKHYSTLKQDIQDILESVEEREVKKLSIRQRVKKIFRDKRMNNRRVISRENMNTVVGLELTDFGVRLNIPLEEMDTYNDKRDELIGKYDRYKELYGLNFTNSQDIYVLLPLHVQLNNDEYVWLNAVLFVFQNKMGILKLELPLSNVNSQPLMEYEYNMFIKNVEIPWLINMSVQKNTIEEIQEAYRKKFIEDNGISARKIGAPFRNILLSDFDGMPKQIGNIPNKVMVDLFRIIAAPVTITECASYERDAQKYINECQWSKQNSKYICSTTGAILSITDIAFREYYMKLYKQEWGLQEFTEQEKKRVYELVISNLCLNVEYAIVIMILKYINKEKFYFSLLRKPQAMHCAKKEFNMNVMFISELQEGCFGTVSEQIETFERVMPYYLKEKITTDKLNAIDCIIADEEAKKQEALQNVIGFGGLLIAALFGLPAIYETNSIIRRMCTFIRWDIPFLTIENFSIFVWVITLCVLGRALSIYPNNKNKTQI